GRRPQVIDAEIDRRYAPTRADDEREVASDVDKARDRSAVILAGAGPAFELGAHRHDDHDALVLGIYLGHPHAAELQEGGSVKHRVDLARGSRWPAQVGRPALPKPLGSMSSCNEIASSLSGRTEWITGFSRPSAIICSSSTWSSTVQLFEPMMLNSNDQ